ncbi:hypothetical protein HYPSUDRAFT_560831 [Hypholoma sublateritium FD-334 SS-4]|uniref:SUZ domain-containing protein n=1 Tax=Hypholoma sublateritium (strain FD-334 SS-4) TaxID=945553 RepID=A0A0D2NYP4_HYPSF|nr:hypothetical protein HYPSUDRAFT_560831 [Hypholoma sublateritium FD-334 SS-4]
MSASPFLSERLVGAGGRALSSPTRYTDSWEEEPRQPSVASSSENRLRASAPTIVPDDWELDDEEEEEATGISLEEKNKQIWEDANLKIHHPMPTLVISRGASTSVSTPSLPLNQPPPMKILKRPSASASPSSTNTSTPVGETFREREARYQVARERIFGVSSEQAADSADPATKAQGSSRKANSPASPLSPATKVVRNPRGPPNTTSGAVPENGFKGRRKPSTPVGEASSATSLTNLPV